MTKQKKCYMQGGNLGRKIYFIRFPTIQVSDHTGQRNSTVGHTRNMCRQNHNIILYQFICRTPGCNKDLPTISDKFFIPGLMHYLRSFLKGCHICQLVRNDKPPTRQLQTRIILNYRPLCRLSLDLKVMPRSQKGH